MNKPLILGALLACSAAAIATPAPETTKSGSSNGDDQVICRREPVIGSRVNTERVCHTRGQWAEQRRVNRQAIDQATAAKPSSGN